MTENEVESDDSGLLTFGGHLDVLRKMLLRVVGLVIVLACTVFCFKDTVFAILLAPREADFCTFRAIENTLCHCGIAFQFSEFNVPLINTELSAQFMTHITVSCMLAALLASPYILFELFQFISPALYARERKYAYPVAGVTYLLFIAGVAMSYFVIFPISFRFLATYQVSDSIANTITLDSYLTTFTTLTFMMGIVFQIPVFTAILGKMNLIDSTLLGKYRAYALIIIMIVAAIITPPDLFTLLLVTAPIYGLYEVSIIVLRRIERKAARRASL